MNVNLDPHWKELLAEEFEKDYFHSLVDFVKAEYASNQIFPSGKNIFRALDRCRPEDVKVVIIGQDPYHGDGQANGLCFSVGDDVQLPPSLKNIFKEIHSDIGTPPPQSGNLDRWADQGVLLLNSVLTVRAHCPASHKDRGWETFTNAVVSRLSQKYDGIVYLLWGSYAQRKASVVDPERNCILKSVHPSPLSAYGGFFGCKHFSATNNYLKTIGKDPIAW